MEEEVARSKITLDAEESRELQRRIKATTVAVRDRQRAEIIVLSAAGISQNQIASRVGVSRVTVNHWHRRFLDDRLAGLEDAAGRGRKPSLPLDAVRMVLDQAVTPPATLGRWSCRKMALSRRASQKLPSSACGRPTTSSRTSGGPSNCPQTCNSRASSGT